MSCKNFDNTDCKENTNQLNIDQDVNDIDQLTCMTNTLLQSLAASCDINIDYSNFLACNQSKIDNTFLPNNPFLLRLAECKKEQDPNFDVNTFLQRAIRAFKTLKFVIDSSRGLEIPVKCTNDTQSNDGNCDPSKCTIPITYQFDYANFNTPVQISKAICKMGPLMCSFDLGNFPPDFLQWYSGIKNNPGAQQPPYVYNLPSGWTQPKKTGHPNDCVNILPPKHAILLTGASCITINGQDYIDYTFKDTYTNAHGQISWTMRIPINNTLRPFSIGMGHPFGSGLITRARIVNCPRVKDKYEKCCTPTPTLTPTPQPSVTPTPTLTSTVTPTPQPSATPTPSSSSPVVTPTPSSSSPTVTPTPSSPYGYGSGQSIKFIP